MNDDLRTYDSHDSQEAQKVPKRHLLLADGTEIMRLAGSVGWPAGTACSTCGLLLTANGSHWYCKLNLQRKEIWDVTLNKVEEAHPAVPGHITCEYSWRRRDDLSSCNA